LHVEKLFIIDQRTDRKMVIGKLDTATTAKNIKRAVNTLKKVVKQTDQQSCSQASFMGK